MTCGVHRMTVIFMRSLMRAWKPWGVQGINHCLWCSSKMIAGLSYDTLLVAFADTVPSPHTRSETVCQVNHTCSSCLLSRETHYSFSTSYNTHGRSPSTKKLHHTSAASPLVGPTDLQAEIPAGAPDTAHLLGDGLKVWWTLRPSPRRVTHLWLTFLKKKLFSPTERLFTSILVAEILKVFCTYSVITGNIKVRLLKVCCFMAHWEGQTLPCGYYIDCSCCHFWYGDSVVLNVHECYVPDGSTWSHLDISVGISDEVRVSFSLYDVGLIHCVARKWYMWCVIY